MVGHENVKYYEVKSSTEFWQVERLISTNKECAVVYEKDRGVWAAWVYGGFLFDTSSHEDALDVVQRHVKLWETDPSRALGNPPNEYAAYLKRHS